jgi:hypothetical protein
VPLEKRVPPKEDPLEREGQNDERRDTLAIA